MRLDHLLSKEYMLLGYVDRNGRGVHSRSTTDDAMRSGFSTPVLVNVWMRSVARHVSGVDCAALSDEGLSVV